MRAKDISHQAPGGERTKLIDVLPLDTPYVIQVFPVYGCNFRCKFCIFSIPEKSRHFISDDKFMNVHLYNKCVVQMKEFPSKIKVVRFVGIGEPLLHPNIDDMVRKTAEESVANTIEIITNGSLLTPELSVRLLDAGLTSLLVSVHGTDHSHYSKWAQATLDFKKFIDQLKYFYHRKGSCKMYIKVMAEEIDNDDEFYAIYGDICDNLAIEHAVPIHGKTQYVPEDCGLTQFGVPKSKVTVCSQPFYHMQINPDGKVVPCYSFEYPVILGDVHDETLVEIWRGHMFNGFRRAMVGGGRGISPVCSHCSIIDYRQFPEDSLEDRERLRGVY